MAKILRARQWTRCAVKGKMLNHALQYPNLRLRWTTLPWAATRGRKKKRRTDPLADWATTPRSRIQFSNKSLNSMRRRFLFTNSKQPQSQMQKVIRKLHHTTTVDNHKSTTNLGENHIDTCLRHPRFFGVLRADVIQKPKTHISDAESYQKTAS